MNKKWVLFFLYISIALLLGIFVINYTIDPYGNNEYLVSKRYKPVLNERNKKYDYIFYQKNYEKYDCVILGSSRVMSIVPNHNESTKSCYNFGVHVANNSEKLFILKEWLKHSKLKKVYLGLEFYNFHKNKAPLVVNELKFKDGGAGNYLALSTLKLSYKSFKNLLNDTPQTYFEDDGNINYFNKDLFISKNMYDFSDARFEIESNGTIEGNFINDRFEIEEGVYEILKEIKDFCKKNGVELIVFITPNHKSIIDYVSKVPELSEKFQKIRNKLSSIFGKINDFSTYNQYNIENKNFYDPWHYRSAYGDVIIKTVDKK